MSINPEIRNLTNYNVNQDILVRIFSDWGKENFKSELSCTVYLCVKKNDSDQSYCIALSDNIKKQVEKLEKKNQILSLLKVRLSNYTKKEFPEKVAKTLQYRIFFDYTSAEIEEIMSKITPNNEKNNDTVLNVLPIDPQFSLDQVVLPKEKKEEIEDVVALLKNISKIYYDWGFIDVDPVPRSIINLWGPPGTGKTMCVHAIAREMGKKLLILNYADIESKYVGDAPKNLVAAFDLALKEDAIIFFDEADSFLGKRITTVSQSSDQAVNSLRSQMLMELETFNGTVFFATNLHENYDRAFESRILKHIEFVLPDLECRKILVQKKFPKKAPFDPEIMDADTQAISNEVITSLAEVIDGFSGREIKNCVLEALIKASKSDNPLLTKDLLLKSFKEAKERFDAINHKDIERKEALTAQVKNNLEKKNYKKRKLQEIETKEVL